MTRTVDIGYSKQKQYTTRKRRRHAVEKDKHGRWILLCTETAATREYKGWIDTVSCQACQEKLGIKEELE